MESRRRQAFAEGYLEEARDLVAVPTITAVDPASGRSKGRNVVRIDGTDFRIPTVPPVGSGYLGGAAQQTVSVEFGGVRAEWAEAASSSVVYCRVPIWAGSLSIPFPVDVDVRVANLDDAGSEIAGENATLVDGYQYVRPTFSTESYLMRVIGEVITLLRRHLIDNVAVTLSREYDDDPTTEQRLRDTAPSIHLAGPRMPINRFYSENRLDSEEDPGDAQGWIRKAVPVTTDLEFAIRIWATNPTHLTGLVQQYLLLFRDVVTVEVENDPAQPALGSNEYEIEVRWEEYPDLNVSPNFSDLYSATSGLIIRGVHIDDESATIIDRGQTVWANDGDPVLETETL